MAKEKKILKHRRHSQTGHIIRHNEFVVNTLKEQHPEKKTWEDLDYNTQSTQC
jgi:hypothetical protein